MASSDVLTFLQELLRDLPTGDSEAASSVKASGSGKWAGHALPGCSALPSSGHKSLTQNNFLPRPLGFSFGKKEALQPSDRDGETGALALPPGVPWALRAGQVMGRQEGGWEGGSAEPGSLPGLGTREGGARCAYSTGRWVGERGRGGGREREGESGQAVCQARTVTSILGQWRPWGLPARRGLVSMFFILYSNPQHPAFGRSVSMRTDARTLSASLCF